MGKGGRVIVRVEVEGLDRRLLGLFSWFRVKRSKEMISLGICLGDVVD